MNVIYTRTSSKSTFFNVSVPRQKDFIIKQFNLPANFPIYSDCCKDVTPLEERPEFKKILALPRPLNIYIECATRITRTESILRQVLALKDIKIYSAIDTALFQSNEKETEFLLKSWVQRVNAEKTKLIIGIEQARKSAKEQNLR
jgi:phage/plasmid-associated DNA primase